MAGDRFVCKLAVLGDGGVGKTALISQFRSKTFVEEVNSYTIDVGINGEVCTLEILDTAGVDEYLHLREGWIRSNEGFILVYSISSKLSFIRIQELYDQIQQIKLSLHPHTTFHIPIIIVGSKADMVEREVSLLEGRKVAQRLGCRFVEVLAKDGRNVENSFSILIPQLRKFSEEQALLSDLVYSLPRWYYLLNKLESEISSSQIELTKANRGAHVPVYAMNVVTERPDTTNLSIPQLGRISLSTLLAPGQQLWCWGIKMSTLKLPRLTRRNRSFLDVNSCQPPSGPESFLAWPKQKATSVDCNISQPLNHPDRSVLEGNYNVWVQNGFLEVIEFLSSFGRPIGGIEKQARLAALIARGASDIGDNYIDSEVGRLNIKDTEGKPSDKKVDETDTILEVKKVLDRCQKLCEDAAFKILQHGESKGNLRAMKNDFVRMTERITSFR